MHLYHNLKHYQSGDDSVWLVQSGYSVWGHQNDLHVITLMKQHFKTEMSFQFIKWIEIPS